MTAGINDLIDTAIDVLGTMRDDVGGTNSITAQLGDAITEQATAHNAIWMQHCGFMSRPSIPSPGKAACQAMSFNDSGNLVCFASRDLRGQQLSANLREGETVLYGSGKDGNAQGRVAIKQDGSITLYTTSNNLAAGGSGMFLRLGPDGFRIETPFGRIVMDKSGIHMIHSSGARLDLGGIGGLPAPLDQVSSYATVTAAIVHANGGVSTLLGPNPTQQVVGTGGAPLIPISVVTPSGLGSAVLTAGSGSVMTSP